MDSPFIPLEGVYEKIDKGRLYQMILFGLQRIIGPRYEAYTSSFRTLVKQVLDQEYPRLRCSSLRAVMEGRMGDPIPIKVPSIHQAHCSQTMAALDFLETLSCLHLEQRLNQLPKDFRDKLREVSDVIGTNKIPGLVLEPDLGVETVPESIPQHKRKKYR